VDGAALAAMVTTTTGRASASTDGQVEREQIMTTNGTYTSIYDQRVRLVADALVQNSKLADKAAVALAVHVLDAIDHIPEKVR
jgi:hypothetical protein